MFKHDYQNLKNNYKRIRNIEFEFSNTSDISKFIHKNDRLVKETPNSQIRLLKKWENNKNNLRLNTLKNRNETKSDQLQKLSLLVDIAFNTVPLYRKLYGEVGFQEGDIVTWEDFESLPIINKKYIVANMADAVVSNPINELNTARTSGSSGLNLTIFQGSSSVDKRCLLYMRHCEQMLGRNLDCDDLRYGIYFASERYSTLGGKYPYLSVSQDCPVDLFVQHLRKLKPALLLAFPSYLKNVADTGVDLKSLGVEAICTNSESSSQKERNFFENVFKVPVYDEYSSEEMSLIATQCSEKKYHIVEDSVYFETIEKDSENNGRIILTNLNNFVMPFIRYDQGDIGSIDNDHEYCQCGNKFRTIKCFTGRADSQLVSKNIGSIDSNIILGLCDKILVPVESGISEYQIIQTSISKIELNVVKSENEKRINTVSVNEFIRALHKIISDDQLDLELNILEKIPKVGVGKRRLIINKIRS